jgi:hypothetical protein
MIINFLFYHLNLNSEFNLKNFSCQFFNSFTKEPKKNNLLVILNFFILFLIDWKVTHDPYSFFKLRFIYIYPIHVFHLVFI